MGRNAILLGRVMVPDFLAPRAQDVDVDFMHHRMRTIVRFNGNPAALTLEEHHRVTRGMALNMGLGAEAADWAGRHDLHEYATGDHVRPMQAALGYQDSLSEVQDRWDEAICDAMGFPRPSARVRAEVARADAVALGLEWSFALGRKVSELGLPADIADLCADGALFWCCLTRDRRQEIMRARGGAVW